jgi:hypothetical protein
MVQRQRIERKELKMKTIMSIGLCMLLICTGIPIDAEPSGENDTQDITSYFDITRDEAIQILINDVIKPGTLDHEVIAFGLDDPLGIGDHVSPFLPALESWNASEIPNLAGGVTLTRVKWFFWVDDLPLAEYAHDTRFVYIDADNGVSTVTYEQWWCLINGEPQWVEEEDYLNPMNWVFSNFTLNPEYVATGSQQSSIASSMISDGSKKDNSSGLVINGWSKGQKAGEFQPNAENMTAVFNQMGLNTTSMGPATQPRATEANILSYLYAKAQQLVPCEDMFIYITGHGTPGGSDYGSVVINNTYLYIKHLKEALKKFRPGVHIYVQIQSCYSEQFINMGYCEGIDASAQGATVYGEGSNSHGGRTKAWVHDYKKLLANETYINNLKAIANHFSWRGLLYRAAKLSAKSDDPDAKLPKNRGRTKPVDKLYDTKNFIQKAANATHTLYQNAVLPDEKEKLGRAYDHLINILAEGVWSDVEHIETSQGTLVFPEAQLALQELESIDPGANFSVQESILIVELLMNVIDIAETVENEAQGIIPLNPLAMPQIIQKRTHLDEMMRQAQEQLNASHHQGNTTFSEVIPTYQDIWTSAQAIIRIAQRPPVIIHLPLTWQDRLDLITHTFMDIYDAKLLQLTTPDVDQANQLLQKADTWYARGMQYYLSGNLIISRICFERAQTQAGNAHTLLQDQTPPDTIPPELVMTSPMNGQENIPVTVPITIDFSESMNKLSVQRAISLSPQTTYNITWDEAAKAITVLPMPHLLFNTQYVVTITTTAEDVAANHLPENYTFSFTTEPSDDTIPPESWALPPGGYVYPDTSIQIAASDEGGSGVFYIHFEVWYMGAPVHSEEYYGDLVEFQFQQYGIYEGSVDLIFWAVDNAGNQEIPIHVNNYIIMY